MVNRPTINKIDVFDASMPADIEFCWQGIQPYASRLYIYESDASSESSQPVFTQYCESIRLRQQIPANTQKNSHSYYAVIILYDYRTAFNIDNRCGRIAGDIADIGYNSRCVRNIMQIH